MVKYNFLSFLKIKKNKYFSYILITKDWFDIHYKNTSTLFPIICPKHGIIYQSLLSIKNKASCRLCYEEAKKIDYDDFKKKFRKNYNYSFLTKDWFKKYYINTYSKLKIKCDKNHIFYQTSIEHFTNKNNCPFCSGVSYDKFKKKYFDIYQNIFKLSEKEFLLLKKNNKKIPCFCNKHGKHYKNFRDVYNGNSGCPKCKFSKGEKRIAMFLEDHDIVFRQEVKLFGNYRFDFYLEDLNTVIEYDGELHFKSIEHFGGEEGLKKTKRRDKIKTEYCKNNNIVLIRIPYWNFNNIETILLKYLIRTRRINDGNRWLS